ncbi:MAG: ABC transporter permease [Candidatus Methylacidiphilales bacterium]|nr:ABC-2 family transporter protein [Candidatus Methylacidiphilales bacterium]
MPPTLALYVQVLKIGLQGTLVYRWNFLIRSVVGFLPLVCSLFLWGAVFEKQNNFGTYTYATMISYFILIMVLDGLTSPTEDDFQIANEIKDGLINQVLLKPLNYFTYRLMLYVSARSAYIAIAAVPLVLFCILLRQYLEVVPWGQTILPTLLAVIGSALLQFLMTYTTAMLAFWLLDIGSVVFIVYSVEYLAGGHIFPLDVLPPHLYSICMSLPFAYQYYFPVAVCLGKVSGESMLYGFLMQWFWIGFFYFFAQAMWQRGLRTYTAVGG